MNFSDLAAFLLRAVGLGLASWGLTLGAWSVVRWQLSRAPGALRLSALVLTTFALNTVVVVGLGLAGVLRTPYYLLACGLLGAVAMRLTEDLHGSLGRLLGQQLRLWSRPRLIAPAAALWLLVLCHNSLLIDDIDSLSLHGPWIVEMVQSGRLLLQTQFNYPLLWEFQFVPVFMILGSDALAILPRILVVVAALMAIQSGARSLGVPGTTARLLAWLCSLHLLIWRGGALKSDTLFAVALLISLIAAERTSKRHPGGPFLALIGCFILTGTKATGFVYAGLVSGMALGLHLLRTRGGAARLRQASILAPLVLACLAIPGTVQIANTLRTGSPFHPIAFNPAGIEIFPGPRNLGGTSILDHATELETWKELLAGVVKVAPELPAAMLALAIAGITAGLALVRARRAGKSGDGLTVSIFVGCGLVAVLWLLYLGTPWSRGNAPDNFGYLKNGQSLRYATGQLFATYILAAAFLRRRFGRRFCGPLATLVLPALTVNAWYDRPALLRTLRTDLLPGLLALIVLALLAYQLRPPAAAVGVLARRGPLAPARPVLLAAVALALAVTLRYQVEIQREKLWMPRCKAVWQYARTHIPPGSEIALSARYPTYRYLVYGARLSNVLLRPPRQRFTRWLDDSEARYLYFKPNRANLELDRRRLERLLARGWVSTSKCRGGLALLLERERAPAAEGS